MFHRIGYEARHLFGNRSIVAIHRTEKQMIAHIIGHREVPPDISRTLDSFVNPRNAVTGNIGNDTVSCPHNLNGRIEFIAQRSQIIAIRIRPAFIVFRRAHYQLVYIRFYLCEFLINVVQQFRLFLRISAFAGDIIKEYGERTDTELIHLLKLSKQKITVFLIPFDILSRMDRPYKVNFVFVGHRHQFLQLGSFFVGIRQTPVGSTMIRIIFRTVYISVHLVFTIKLQLAKACLMTPGSSVKSFYHSTIPYRRVIFDFYFGQLSVFQQLRKSLQSVISTSFVVSGQYDFLFIHRQVITFFVVRNLATIFTHTLVTFLSNRNKHPFLAALLTGKQFFQYLYSMRIGFFPAIQLIDSRQIDGLVLNNELLRRGLQTNILRKNSNSTQEAGSQQINLVVFHKL